MTRGKINKNKTTKRDICLLTFDTCNHFGQTRSEDLYANSTDLHVK